MTARITWSSSSISPCSRAGRCSTCVASCTSSTIGGTRPRLRRCQTCKAVGEPCQVGHPMASRRLRCREKSRPMPPALRGADCRSGRYAPCAVATAVVAPAPARRRPGRPFRKWSGSRRPGPAVALGVHAGRSGAGSGGASGAGPVRSRPTMATRHETSRSESTVALLRRAGCRGPAGCRAAGAQWRILGGRLVPPEITNS